MVKISDYLKENYMKLSLESKEKEAAIRELAEVFRHDEHIKDFSQLMEDVFEREALGTTGIGLGLALPHARTDAVDAFVIAVGRSEEGIEFGALDGEPVKLVFLMATPKAEVQSYLKILAHLTRILKKESFRTSLLEAKTPQELIDCFKKEESIEVA
jgi:fructose-specific phosphotransferase system IIA component